MSKQPEARQLIILRGVSGAGKSSLAAFMYETINDSVVVEADHFMTDRGLYKFERNRLAECHRLCREHVEGNMDAGVGTIIMSNTSTTEKELVPYIELAKRYQYKVVSLVVENRHGNGSVHNVPEETLALQASRFSIKLR